MIKVISVSSLDKVFVSKKPTLYESGGSMLKNERYSFQVWIYSHIHRPDCRVALSAPCGLGEISVRVIDHVPVMLACRPGDSDDYVINKENEAGLFPDVLRPLNALDLMLRPRQWTGLWVTTGGENCKAGIYDIAVDIFDKSGECLGGCGYKLEVVDYDLPKSDIIYTNWVHYDCIARRHGLKLFSKEYYKILNLYLKKLYDHGGNMLYTPAITPALDTEKDKERDTVQLVDVSYNNGIFKFGFDRLERFIDNAMEIGFEFFEFSHLATQWGAEYCPKIVVKKDNTHETMFGWHTRSDSALYLEFLSQYFPALHAFLSGKKLVDKVRFHISDEPGKEHLETYRLLSGHIKRIAPWAKTMDALSDYEFFSEGAVDTPVVSLDKTAPFKNGDAQFWVYASCGKRYDYVSNRFINMPSQRNRILGFQLYLNGVKGYLHWGYNFYLSLLSRMMVNPYHITDGGGGYEAGDAFIVYPAENEVLDSLRHEVLFDAWQDYRALKALQQLYSKSYVMELLRAEGLDAFEIYPHSAVWHKAFREKINTIIKNKINNGTKI